MLSSNIELVLTHLSPEDPGVHVGSSCAVSVGMLPARGAEFSFVRTHVNRCSCTLLQLTIHTCHCCA